MFGRTGHDKALEVGRRIPDPRPRGRLGGLQPLLVGSQALLTRTWAAG